MRTKWFGALPYRNLRGYGALSRWSELSQLAVAYGSVGRPTGSPIRKFRALEKCANVGFRRLPFR
jgi:hypothetical protein